jgi:signal peptidase I
MRSTTATRAARTTLGWAWRLAGIAAGAMTVALVGCLAGLLMMMAGGYRPMIEQSDSMAPVMRAGDLLMVRRITAAQARPHDVVTFDDAEHPGRTLTHRVVSVTPAHGATLAFVTRGDANTGVERWTVEADGVIGRYAFRVPAAGRVVRAAGTDIWRLVVVLAALSVAADVLRRIWRTPAPPTSLPSDSSPHS